MRSPRRRHRRPLFRIAVTTTTALALVATGVTAPTQAAPEPAKPGRPTVSRTGSVSGGAVPVQPRPADPAAEHAVTSVPAVFWPKAGTAEVAVNHSAVRVADTAVSVSAAGGGPDRVRVEVLDRSAAQRAGVEGVLFRVRRADPAQKAGPVTVDVDYSGFRHAYGGDYAARLALVRLPACAAWAPQRAECVTGTPVTAHNDLKTGHLRGEVHVTGAPRAKDPEDARAGLEPDALFAVTATPSGSAGSFRPTSLAPSAMWEVGLQSGDFTWAYPLDLPPVPGPEPTVALSYSSGGIDGRTPATNNQSSWIGDGFDFQPGFIERQYTSCAGTGDLCYATANAVVSLPGVTGELVFDATKQVWRAEEDDGWRVEQLFGAANGDNDGEYWQLTAPDGTRYTFGRATDARSAWTVPVFGDDSGEPCKAASFGVSWCQQAYRWQLDQVVDRHGDTIKYFYDTETNHYGRNNTASLATPYVRGGQLSRVDYGLRDNQTEPAARVVFTAADRCVPGSACQRTTTADWPDVPWDQQCDGGVCTGRLTPVFFGTKRLAKITAQVRDGANLRDVDSWTLNHLFPSTGDTTSPSLWLESIVHTGHIDGTATMPEVNFDGQLRDNRVDAVDGQPRMSKWRVSRVNTETGGRIDVTYGPVGCSPGALPAADVNGTSCFPAHWMPQGASAPVLDWFHKYLVTEVREVDRVGGSPDEVTSYEYVGDAAWHHDDAELTPTELKTWGQWRGYQTVKVRTGDPSKPRTLVEHRFFRGMFGDVKFDGTTKTDKVGPYDDLAVLRGFAHEEITYDGDGGPEVGRVLHEPVVIGPNAVRHRASGDLGAYVTEVKRTYTRTALAGGGHRETEEQHFYDEYGAHVRTNDLGDLSTPNDDTCTLIDYARNTEAWLIATANRVRKLGVACGSPERPADVLSDQRTYYDGSDEFGAAPTKGDPTRQEELSGWDGGTPRYTTVERSVYDAHGREVEEFDALGNKETTAYTPAVGGPVTSVVTTNALGHTDTTVFNVAVGEPVQRTDENGRRTTMVYDPLGRLTKVWRPGRALADVPDLEFEYVVRSDGPSSVATKKLLGDGTQMATRTLFDGQLRERQVQHPSPAGGRIVTDTLYDSHGRVAATNNEYHNADPPGPDLLLPTDVPARTVFGYDGAGREVAEVFEVGLVEKWRTTTAYGGDRVTETPPAGGTVTTKVFDAEGRTTELRQHRSAAEYDSTRYTYSREGELETVTDPAGNVWRTHYDVRGRAVRVDDPDQGTTTMTYDDEDRLLSTTNSRGKTVAHAYDPLGRRTASYEGSASGPKLAEWVFDVLADGTQVKGVETASVRYSGGQAYRDEVLAVDDQDRPLRTAVTIPAAEGRLAGRYESTLTYNDAGQVTSATLPAVGGLPAETLQYGYDQWGNPDSLTGLAPYVRQTAHNDLGEVAMYIMGAEGRQVFQLFDYEPGTRRLAKSTLYQENDTAPVVDRTLDHDPAGNLTRLVTAAAGRAVDTQCFRHDHLRRMTDAWTADDCGTAPGTLTGPAPYWHSYTFDQTGNRLTETRHETGTTRRYSYPPAGGPQPHTLTSVTTSGPGGARTDTFTYDSEGNTVTRAVDGRTQSFEWAVDGELTKVTEGDTETAYVYDADGDRLLRRDPEGTTLYLGSTTEVRVDKVGLVTGTRYYEHNEDTIAVRTGENTLSWLSADHHDTAETSVDAESLSATHRLLLPFGEERGDVPGAWPGERGFVGGTKDASTGLTHLGAREYDPRTGRFLSVDPVIDEEDPQSLHGYLYANNNPYTYTDPDGLFWSNVLKKVAKVAEVASWVPGPIGTAAGLVGAAAYAATGNKGKALEMAAGAAANLVPGGKLLMKAGMAAAKAVGKAGAKAGAKGAVAAAKTGKAVAKAAKGTAKGAKTAATRTGRTVKRANPRGCNSFTADTPVLMADGTRKPIGQVVVGDRVLAGNPLTGEAGARQVTDTIVGAGLKDLVTVEVAGGVVVATAGHPFWVVEEGRWKEAGELEPGDTVLTEGGVLRVAAVDRYSRVLTVHNLTVDDLHTYYVGRDDPVLVHNAGSSCQVHPTRGQKPNKKAACTCGKINKPGKGGAPLKRKAAPGRENAEVLAGQERRQHVGQALPKGVDGIKNGGTDAVTGGSLLVGFGVAGAIWAGRKAAKAIKKAVKKQTPKGKHRKTKGTKKKKKP
ncbi:polymorphic toxin-type HINT domain-containing protein [Saccharothrix sp.]|uniref:polymorphic toxin-type HINT domain-containing protein n=1 Tax=Saccharothrix sp. TaxID=1873460 RepID=UPI0028112C79|nr:polymorphic toxin-type HINT domain-containing protein [Saccharothrix sp.]